MSQSIRLVDTTLRDGHHSLWAMGMRTGMMLPVAEALDGAGFKAIEVFGAGHFRKCVKELRDDPWERLRLMSERIRKTPMAFMMLPSVSVFEVTPYCVMQVYVDQLARHGISRIQIIEPSNDFNFRLPEIVKMIRAAGMQVVIGLVYSLSPKHTDAYYRTKAREAVALAPDALFIKDPAGLLTPERTRTLTAAVLEGAGATPVEFHGHCTTGLMPACYVEAMRHKVDALHTAVPPLADGPSLPSVFAVARNMQSLGIDVPVDLEALRPVEAHFREIAETEGFAQGAPVQFDVAQYVHHVPGGVISHLHHQLRQIGMIDRLDDVLEEVGKVRADLGYPIMVTPFSQFVCSQAALNVISGERYKQVSDEVIRLVLGQWGAEAAAGVDPDIRDLVQSMPRSRVLAGQAIEEIDIGTVRARLGGASISDTDLILLHLAPAAEIEAMRRAEPPRPYETGMAAIPHLLRELIQRDRFDRIEVTAGEDHIRLGR